MCIFIVFNAYKQLVTQLRRFTSSFRDHHQNSQTKLIPRLPGQLEPCMIHRQPTEADYRQAARTIVYQITSSVLSAGEA